MDIKRLPAAKVRISEIVDGKFYPGSKETMAPSYVISPFGERLARANILATVTDKFASEDGNYASLTLDDGSGAMQARAFGEDAKMFGKVDVGDLAIVIGKLKEYNDEVYVNAESVKKADANYENLRKSEILERLISRKSLVREIRQAAEEMDEEELLEHAKKLGIDKEQIEAMLERKEVDYKPKMLDLIESMDDGEGVEIGKLFEISKLPEHIIERAIDELLTDGEIYEPIVGKLKRIKG
jgi:RPA family protein